VLVSLVVASDRTKSPGFIHPSLRGSLEQPQQAAPSDSRRAAPLLSFATAPPLLDDPQNCLASLALRGCKAGCFGHADSRARLHFLWSVGCNSTFESFSQFCAVILFSCQRRYVAFSRRARRLDLGITDASSLIFARTDYTATVIHPRVWRLPDHHRTSHQPSHRPICNPIAHSSPHLQVDIPGVVTAAPSSNRRTISCFAPIRNP